MNIPNYSMFDTSPQSFCVIRVELDENGAPEDWTFLYCNDALAELEGYPKEKLVGLRFFDLFPDGDRKWLEPYYEAAYENKISSFDSVSNEIGKCLHVDCFPLNETGICGCMLRTASQQAEYKRQLKSNASAANLLHTAITTGLWQIEYNENGEPTQCIWSEAFRKILGYNSKGDFPEEIASWLDKIHPEDRSVVEEQYNRTVYDYSGNETYDIEYRMLNKQGEYHWVRDTAHISRRTDGSPDVVDGIIMLVDEKHNAEETIRNVLHDNEELQKLLNVEKQYSELLFALSKIYREIVCVDLTKNSYHEIFVAMGRNNLHHDNFAQEAFLQAIDYSVSNDYKKIMSTFLNHATLPSRLSGRDYISQDYLSIIGTWFCASYVVQKRDKDGNVTHVLFTLQNISAQMEKELKRQRQVEQLNRRLKEGNQTLEEQLHIISGLSNAFFAVYKVYLRFNRCRALKNIDFFANAVSDCKTTDDTIQAFISLCVMPEDFEKMKAFTDQRTLAERMANTDLLVQEFHGTIDPWNWCRASWIVADRDKNGRVINALFAIEDVTVATSERKKLEEERNQELIAAETRIRTMAEGIHGGFKRSLNDEKFTLIMVSEHLSDMLGYDSPKEMMERGVSMIDMVNEDDAKRELPQATEDVLAGRMYTMHYRIRCKDGSWKNVEDRGRLIRGTNGKEEYWSFITDQEELTQKTKALEMAKQANLAAEQAQHTAEVARKAAEAANQAKSDFLFNISHDIRTPMNAILGYSELSAKNSDVPEIVREYLKKIQISGQGMLSLFDNVLELSRIESGKIVLEESAQAADSVLETCMIMMNPEIEKRRHTITFSKQIRFPYICFDATRLTEVVLNILSNAIKYTADGGIISCTLSQYPNEKAGWIDQEFSVADNGIGISETFLEHIFESFTRERTTTESGIQGTGLGMGIVKKLVNLMGGTISVQSEIDKGTTVTVRIPCRIATFEGTQPKFAVVTPNYELMVGKRILLAEDNDLNAEIAETLLKDLGLLVERVANGAECVEMLENKPAGFYDLILMDIQMPIMNGYAATEKIRKLTNAQKAEIPIIAMSANAFSEDKAKAVSVGMNDYVAKPVDMNKLIPTLLQNI